MLAFMHRIQVNSGSTPNMYLHIYSKSYSDETAIFTVTYINAMCIDDMHECTNRYNREVLK